MRPLGIRTVAIADIEIGARLRETDPHWVETFAAMIASGSTLPPITGVRTEDDRFHRAGDAAPVRRDMNTLLGGIS